MFEDKEEKGREEHRGNLQESLNISGPYQLRLEIDITKDGTFSLANESGEYLEIFVSATTGKLVTRRTGNTGLISFASNYAIPTIKSPFNTEGDKIILDIFVDQSSVEIFTQNGSMAQTNLIFPRSIYNRLQTTDMELKAQIRPLDNIWM
jgi:fructan beta-fructosidase